MKGLSPLAVVLTAVVLFILLATSNANAGLSDAQKLHKSESVINWYNHKGRWTLRLRYNKCSDIRSSRAGDRCFKHRTNLRWHIARAQRLRPPPPITYYIPHYNEWLCIYSYENAGYGWSANTGNGYYGGLQMDLEFQNDYGADLLRAKGTADNWTPEEQMMVAERAYSSGRGFYPWPNTARYCGLI